MYGKRIKPKNYVELLACRNIPDIASYLKKKTNYSQTLKDINENSIRRVQLEERLNYQLFVDFEALGRYDISVGEHFFEYIIARAEIEQFMHSLMLLAAGKSGEYIHTIPDFFYSHTKVNLRALKNIRSYDDFLNILKKSHYYKVLLPFKPQPGERIDLMKIETALYDNLYETLFKIIDKYVKNPAKKELIDFFNLYIDLNNLIRIVRMKKFYNLNPEYMSCGLMNHGTLSKEQLQKFINSSSNKQMMADMKSMSMGKKWFSKGLDVIDKVPINMKHNWCRHNIRFSISPPVVLISYIFLKEIEILNITTLIEAVKYHLPAQDIQKMFIGTE